MSPNSNQSDKYFFYIIRSTYAYIFPSTLLGQVFNNKFKDSKNDYLFFLEIMLFLEGSQNK